ncbi:signal peptidase I [Ponticaulis sp.]|uniref:signal peptidase I n=1 Tax=Ponticaulis sp. TaxID=2020902 RepID=UPI000B638D9B|nr:signal peptidase I [Ponticaulis sp.]MAI89489.1 signal peptidase I [Ponticaulis sp.]OUY00525.1 MAG: signal peptidase I [Hyphomonadaceae bacterium TMED5]|tara:strand:- start:147697 stop:148545 length:849 start_codon:yes stop_codon:yes gene_type:complete
MTELSNEEGERPTLKSKVFGELRELIVTIAIFLPIWFIVSLFFYELRSIPSESMVPNLQVGDRVAVSKFAYGYSRYSVPLGLGRLLPDGEGRIMGGEPERGDVVVFRHPHLDRVMIKRLIGLPGDTIQVVDNHIILNGEPMEQSPVRRVSYHEARSGRLYDADELMETTPEGVSYIVHDIVQAANPRTTPVFVVPEGHYFFMGDNRDNSTDGRALTGHCAPNENGVIDRAGCDPVSRPGREPSIGFVPYELLIGRADTVLFTLNFCGRYESGCPEGRVWKSL